MGLGHAGNHSGPSPLALAGIGVQHAEGMLLENT